MTESIKIQFIVDDYRICTINEYLYYETIDIKSYWDTLKTIMRDDKNERKANENQKTN